jgi:hypothetical protein
MIMPVRVACLAALASLLIFQTGCKDYVPQDATAHGQWTFIGAVPVNFIGAQPSPAGVANVLCCWQADAVVNYANQSCNPPTMADSTFSAYHCEGDPDGTYRIPAASIGSALPLPGALGRIPQVFGYDFVVYWPNSAAEGQAQARCEVISSSVNLPGLPNTYTSLPAPISPTPTKVPCP